MHFAVRYFDMPPGAPRPKLSIRFRKRPVRRSAKVFISQHTGLWSGSVVLIAKKKVFEDYARPYRLATDNARFDDPFQAGPRA
jgi:hypothetical protein